MQTHQNLSSQVIYHSIYNLNLTLLILFVIDMFINIELEI
jgi:hypothetical protein